MDRDPEERPRRLGTLRGVGQLPSRAKLRLAAGGLAPGQIVANKFALVRLIAHGATAQVFEAEDMLVERRVALKVLLPEAAQDAEVVRRFRREAHAGAMLNHPNIVTVFEVGRRDDGSLYIVEELLVGPTLEEHTKATGRFNYLDAVVIALPLAGALATAHAHGIVHRDVKPANVILASTSYADQVPKLIDFGVARVELLRSHGKTIAGTLLGTAHYMAPEQASGDQAIDGRVDVWALSVLLYELLSGARPFEGPNDHAILAKVLSDPPTPIDALVPGLPRELRNLVMLGLTKAAPARPSMRDLATALAELAKGSSLLPTPRASAEAIDPSDLDYSSSVLPGGDPEEDELSDFLADDDIELVLDDEPDDPETLGARAEEALRVNALHEAVRLSSRALEQGAPDALVGQLQLIHAVSHFWLGNYEICERSAGGALARLPEGGAPWSAAIGHLALARARLGKMDRVAELKPLLDPRETQFRFDPSKVVAVCRLAVSLTQAGQIPVARQIVRSLREHLERYEIDDGIMFGWLDVAFAERAWFVGDLARELGRRTSAVLRFTSAGDLRTACFERAQLGSALLRMGAFDDAGRIFSEALALAEPMQLSAIGMIQALQARLALRREDAPLAKQLATRAVAFATEHGDRRLECQARVYLAEACAFVHDHVRAYAEADAAAQMALPFPAVRAHALGILAATLLASNRADRALDPARKAVLLLNQHGGAGEAESVIRLSHALALGASGDNDEAVRRLSDARMRLIGLSERFPDPRHRRWFVERIYENARIMELGAP